MGLAAGGNLVRCCDRWAGDDAPDGLRMGCDHRRLLAEVGVTAVIVCK